MIAITYLAETFQDPSGGDYDIQGYHKKRTVTKGELLVVEYYNEYDGTTYSDLQVKEERTFNRDAVGLVTSRAMTISWYANNEVVCIGETIKYYSPAEAIEEGITRRKNIIADAKIYCLSTIGQAYGFDLLNSVKVYVDLFTEGYTQPLRDAVQASTKPYLNSTYKTAIVSFLTF
jgi:hypothetical protein